MEKKQKKAYLIGGGIASLASAVYLIRDGGIKGKNITIFEKSDRSGGSLDGQSFVNGGYLSRGYRIFEENVYSCSYNLWSLIPSLKNPDKTLKDEICDFNKKIKICAKARLIENGKIIDASRFGLSPKDKINLIKFLIKSEPSLKTTAIKDYFSPSFFKTNFWFEVCTIFAFEPWHSAVEFRRYFLRNIHNFPRLADLMSGRSTPYNQYDSIIVPILNWLKKQGVRFEMNSEVFDLDFKIICAKKSVERIHYTQNEKPSEIAVNKEDLVLITIGSMTSDYAVGSMNLAPRLKISKSNVDWTLWENISKKHPEFGRPSVFNSHIDESKFESFTVTFKNSLFFSLMEKFTGNKAGTGGGITFKNSNWVLSMALPHQPHFINQPENTYVLWGYGLFPDKEGNFIKKKMTECSGEEILTELCLQLGFKKELPEIIKASICIPCLMPYITSQFLPRAIGDRPPVIPRKSVNFAFIGEYCEIPDDIVFTMEYSVRSAIIAVYGLLGIKKKIPAIYRGQYDPKIIEDVFKISFEFGKTMLLREYQNFKKIITDRIRR